MADDQEKTRTQLVDELEELRQRLRDLEARRERRRQAVETYRRERAVLDAVNEVLRETLTCETEAEVAATCLRVAEKLTGSKFGFIGEVNRAGRFDTIALSDPGWDECRMPKSQAVRLIMNMEIRGLWGYVLKGRRPLIVNDPASHPSRVGTPPGHPTITSFLAVPLKHRHDRIGMIGLANKASGYDRADQQAVEALSVSLVEAMARKRADEALRLDESRLEALVKLNRMAEAPLRQITEFALEEAVRLTKSKIGYLAFMNEDESVLTMHSWSTQAMKECAIIDKPMVYPVETTGLWGDAVRQRRPVITNDYAAPNPRKKGYPEGHVDVTRHLNVPVFDRERVVVVAGVGNKMEEYDESDVRQLTLLMEGMWRLLQRKKAQEDLRLSEARLRQIIDLVPHMIFARDREGCFLLANRAVSEAYGTTAEQLTGTKPGDAHVSEEQLRRTLEDDREVMESGLPKVIPEEKFVDDDGKLRVLQTTKIPYTASGTTDAAVLGVAVDITAHKRAERELERYRRHLETLVEQRTAELASANKELEAFSYSVAHDLRAPLRAMDGFSQALLEDYAEELDEIGKDYLSRIRAASQSMAALIDHLLELSGVARAEIHREPVDLTVMAKELAARFRREQPERQVAFDLADDLVVTGDRQLLRIVIENLLGNAWKFTSKQSNATIEFRATQIEDERVFLVRDNGAGFDMAYADKLFVPFQRLHGMSEFPGSGVGLTTAQRIVERHGGRIWAEGEVGKGATFYFSLPGQGVPEEGK